MTKRIIAAGIAALVAGSLAACSAPAESPQPSTAAATQAAVVTTPQSSAPAAAAPAVATPAPTRSPGPGSVKSLPGEDVFDFNIRKAFWAELQGDGATAALYESDTYHAWRQQVGFHAPNLAMTTKCTLGARIASTPEREVEMRGVLGHDALDVPGIQLFAYPVLCPDGGSLSHPRNYVLVGAVNRDLRVEELNYVSDGPGTLLFDVPDSDKL